MSEVRFFVENVLVLFLFFGWKILVLLNISNRDDWYDSYYDGDV